MSLLLGCSEPRPDVVPARATSAAPRIFAYDIRDASHPFLGMGVSLHPLETEHLSVLPELGMGYVRIGAGPGWGGMRNPRFPDAAAEMPGFIAEHFNRDDPQRLDVFRRAFRFFQENGIRVILVQYQIPFHWLQEDFMRTLKQENAARLVAQWTALLEFFRNEGMRADFVELANEPDGNWDGHVPARLYYRLVRDARSSFDRAGFEHVGLLGPGLSSLDLEHRSEFWINGMSPAVHGALAGFSLHGWDEVLATDSMPDYLARAWRHPRAAFRRLDPRKPIFLTEYATEITRFGGRDFASPRSGAFYSAAETPRYALRVLANTLVHLDSGVSAPMLWRLSDNDSDPTDWGMIRGPRRGGERRPLFYAVRFLSTRLPVGARVIPGRAADRPDDVDPASGDPLTATLLLSKTGAVWAGVNLDPDPRPVILRLNDTAFDHITGETFHLNGTTQPILSIVQETRGDIALTLPPESAVILRLEQGTP